MHEEPTATEPIQTAVLEVGSRCKDAREFLMCSREKFAAELQKLGVGVSAKSIQRYEVGKQEPRISYVVGIAQLSYDVFSVQWVVTGESSHPALERIGRLQTLMEQGYGTERQSTYDHDNYIAYVDHGLVDRFHDDDGAGLELFPDPSTVVRTTMDILDRVETAGSRRRAIRGFFMFDQALQTLLSEQLIDESQALMWEGFKRGKGYGQEEFSIGSEKPARSPGHTRVMKNRGAVPLLKDALKNVERGAGEPESGGVGYLTERQQYGQFMWERELSKSAREGVPKSVEGGGSGLS